VRYLHALFISEPEDTPDVTGVTFVMAPSALVTVRYDPVETFDLFSQKLCKAPGQALLPDAVAVGLINTGLNRSARALNKAGDSLDRIASAVFRAKGDQGSRNKIYSETLMALGREDEKISNLRESLVSVERLLLFLMGEGGGEKAPKGVREATKTALRDLQSLEEDASFKAQKVQFLLDATLGLINLAQNDIIKLFSVLAVIFMPPTVIASIYGMNFKEMPELEWRFGYPFAIVLMICAAVLAGRGGCSEFPLPRRCASRDDGRDTAAGAGSRGREVSFSSALPSRSISTAHLRARISENEGAPRSMKSRRFSANIFA
jgi:magnesium transporter